MAEVLEKRSDLKDPTPMMQQYFAVKDEYPDYILFYRLGDFYEMFFEDAMTASRVLELTLTGRDCGEGRRAAMCGVPFIKRTCTSGGWWRRAIKSPSASRPRTLPSPRGSSAARSSAW